MRKVLNAHIVAAYGLNRTDFMEEAAMLVLTRKEGQRILIDNQITLIVTTIRGDRVAIGIEAPADVAIQRDELLLPNSTPAAPKQPACFSATEVSNDRARSLSAGRDRDAEGSDPWARSLPID